ncbi:hypothetical protein [Rubripirellula obstinata]|uniref:hypothetical protein n=1 Tax=Rubripirellula obstinata TaxID=406547 RepID=UPI001F1BDB95|nr:hypothetical protein [Rubripirellula obstinata]
MKSSRILTVYIILAALLFGNVAGWVHVGCSGHHSGCCATKLDNACAETSSSRSCCKHDHRDACCSKESEQAENQANDPASELPAPQHDADRCAICQNFFASREAIMLEYVITQIEPLTICDEVAFADDVFTSNHLSSSQTVRGPPRV